MVTPPVAALPGEDASKRTLRRVLDLGRALRQIASPGAGYVRIFRQKLREFEEAVREDERAYLARLAPPAREEKKTAALFAESDSVRDGANKIVSSEQKQGISPTCSPEYECYDDPMRCGRPGSGGLNPVACGCHCHAARAAAAKGEDDANRTV